MTNRIISAMLFTSLSITLWAADTPAPAVVVDQVKRVEVSSGFQTVGRVEATERVDILARVSGFLEKQSFVEGSDVTQGSELFLIEKDSYQIALQQAQAQLAGAQATQKNARTELTRAQALKKRNAVSQAQLDQKAAEYDQAKASVLQAQAGVKRAQLDLSYTQVTSPIAGRIGKANFSTGNLVTPSSGVLATVVNLDPIYVEISVSEKLLIDARRQGINTENPPFAPRLILADGSQYEHLGEFNFVDPEVDPNTDTIGVRATFPNPAHVLLPGQFVTVKIETKQPQFALTVPQSAVQKDREGFFVLAVDRNNIAQIRRVDVGEQFEGLWAIKSGLDQGDRVIVEGLQKAKPGKPVTPTQE
ncbi:efflux RND transporter periplasmic adaptor subunit [Neptunomonas sp. XY-337]|uniref:efflux RND transporter periplasmic adaptor subunit n=1 Tax=Neptunomonas sp. XY-337 TaxID=2561897 RepID=UPI001F0DF5DB|nr:efflux RND transporter periplasmic adaptor subunit [Neptunomonas sp. XY-337]